VKKLCTFSKICFHLRVPRSADCLTFIGSIRPKFSSLFELILNLPPTHASGVMAVFVSSFQSKTIRHDESTGGQSFIARSKNESHSCALMCDILPYCLNFRLSVII